MLFFHKREKKIEQMLLDIEGECRLASSLTGISAFPEKIMNVMAEVPRDEFVPVSMKTLAFENRPLSIGEGQTISQPFIVALMTHLLDPEKDDVILEIGTGSGYQAAVLSKLVRKVYSIEIIPSLAEIAAERLFRLGYEKVEVRAGDGYQGWPELAPFDGIIVTAAATHVPVPLKEQLKPGGKLVIPVGIPFLAQELMVVEKDEKGKTFTRDVLSVAFVPLRRERE
jgi:protein-L-isoaspartate(D-aspartate) O-methyltransferase